jgi:hypothetical protein
MATQAFTVRHGVEPQEDGAVDLGNASKRFRNLVLSQNITLGSGGEIRDADGNLVAAANNQAAATQSQAIAYSIALGA